jgi:MauM/NapG family ferredoxin protein
LIRFQRLIQLLSFAGFLFLIIWAAYPETLNLPLDTFLKLDPLIASVTLITSRHFQVGFLLSLLVLLSALVVGRGFCGYVCPMGTTIDGIQGAIYPKSKLRSPRSGYDSKSQYRSIKYYVLLIVLAAAVGGVSLAFLVAPISLITRFWGQVAYPILLSIVDTGLDLASPLYKFFPDLAYVQISRRVSAANYFIAGFVFFVSALAIISPRFWCSFLCPAGAMLAILSKRPLIRRSVSSSCTQCGRCVRNCPTAAIGEDPHITSFQDCLVCRRCKELCPEKAISFFPGRGSSDSVSVSTDITRRGILLSAFSGLTLASLTRTGWNQPRLLGQERAVTPADLIRPPGAIPEFDFLKLCVRCGLCMKACATNTLQPIWLKAGLEGLFSPTLVPRLAACAVNCAICGSVCPTGAIRKLPVEEKIQAKIGTAWIDRQNCLVWNQDKKCLVCGEVCPYHAISFQPAEGRKNGVPVVHANRCAGCGWCENKCPVEGAAAVRVSVAGEVRLDSGSYIAKAKEYGLEFKVADKNFDKLAPDTFDSSGIDEEPGARTGVPASNKDKLPPGVLDE